MLRLTTIVCYTDCVLSLFRQRFHDEDYYRKMDPCFRCYICKKYFASAIVLRSHVRKAHTVSDAEKYVDCQYCGAKITPVHLESHIQRKHSDAKSEEICPHCDFRTQSGISKLRYHMLTVHNDDSFGTTIVRRCPYCSQTFFHKSDFDRHVKVKHEMMLGEFSMHIHRFFPNLAELIRFRKMCKAQMWRPYFAIL